MTELTTDNVPRELQLQIVEAINLKKQVVEYETSIKKQLEQYMLDNDIKSIKNDVFTASIASRETISANVDELDPKYTKTTVVPDTDKAKQLRQIHGKLPEGFESKVTEYLTWRAK